MHPVAFRNPFERTSQALRIVAVIPARYESTRFPGKPLADIAGRPMIEHVYRRAAEARGVDAVVVATDDGRIAAAVERFGGVVRMTGSFHRTGTDRIAEVAADLPCDIVINVQGDLPLIEPGMIEQVVAPLAADAALDMATLRTAITEAADYGNPNVVKVVVDGRGYALYFSRAPIPFRLKAEATGMESRLTAEATGMESRLTAEATRTGNGSATAYKHIGLYAYRRAFVPTFAALPRTPLEIAESLEQLRALEHGYRIRTVETHFESIEVDTPEDLERVRRHMAVGART